MKKTGIFSALVFAFVNSKTAKYPLLVYKDVTYMPMTYDYCNLLGLESNYPSHVIATIVGNPIRFSDTKT